MTTTDNKIVEFKKLMQFLGVANTKKLLLVVIHEQPIDGDLFDKLYDFYMVNNIMPYDVARAKTQDPWCWIADRIDSYVK